LEARAMEPWERDRVRELLGKEHYLGAGREVGRTPVQVVHHHGRWVALLAWGPAAMKLVDREEMVLRGAIKAGNRGSPISRSSRGERDRDPRGKWRRIARSAGIRGA
ncbi:MAG: hypothetical protein M0Q93_04345, partial [Terrimicrobiaceae bacterium]|nr:hypothetical protein [Terrimicrobiaceae bacterium]